MSYPAVRAKTTRHVVTVALLSSLTIAACTSTTSTARVSDLQGATRPAEFAPSPLPSAPVPAPTTTIGPTTTSAPTTTTVATTTAPSTTTTLPEPLDVFAPDCVVVAEAAASLELIGASNGVVDVVGLWFENGQVDTVDAGQLVDVCPANGINDIDGQSRPLVDDVTARSAIAANVERQQSKLNELFAGSGIADLDVDGVSGPRTGQRLCAARLAFGLATTIADMAPGSNEQAVLFAATGLPTPASSATASERWVLIDRTCQIMFIGAGAETQFIFPTSTGSEGFETRIQDRAEAFRFNPALDNGGWHDSSEYPVGVDNPLNGNLYKPLYFDLGQAIHGANNVPPTPASKGCARLSVADQNTFIAWLGLDTATGETWRKSEMNVTVNVQGDFVTR